MSAQLLQYEIHKAIAQALQGPRSPIPDSQASHNSHDGAVQDGQGLDVALVRLTCMLRA